MMEMDITKLDPATLPQGEVEFIQILLGNSFPFYNTGYHGEQAIHQLLAVQLHHQFDYQNVALLRTGSGGRYEGAGVGEHEFILLTKQAGEPPRFPHEYFGTLIDVAQAPVYIHPELPPVVADVEHKPLDAGSKLSYHSASKTTTPYPGRILEAEFVAGNPALWMEARRTVFQEIVTDKEIIAGMKKDLKRYEKTCETGLSNFKGTQQQFDKESRSVFYDPAKFQNGMKYSFLRYTQTAFAIELYSLIKRKAIPVEDVLDLNQSVEERIRYAFRRGWVRRTEQLLVAGYAYVKACDINCRLKAQFHQDGRTTLQLTEGSLESLYGLLVPTFKEGVLID
jgi:hypothetical protein